jgi:hypothetical protein
MKNLETFELAAESLGIDPSALPFVDGLPEKHQKAVVAGYKLMVISEAAWEGKKPDWSNWNERKYYPWFDLSSGSGVGFSYVVYGHDGSVSLVGSRLVFPTSEIARYVGKTHLELYKDFMLID